MNWVPDGFQPPGWQPPGWQPEDGATTPPTTPPTTVPAGRKPTTRHISLRAMVHHIAGPEQSYPVYNFSSHVFIERPKHNPFADIAPEAGTNGGWGDSFGSTFGDAFG